MIENRSKILIVDDEEDIIEILKYNLEKEGFEVEGASDGAIGLNLALTFKPDLILLDIMMPKMDGIEVCKQLKESGQLPNTMIAFLTARNEDFTHITALESGGDDFINKPIPPRVLVSRVKALLRRSVKSEVQTITTVRDIKIDREKFTVYKADVEIVLAKKQFELLNLLVSKPGKVFTREEIFHKIWGPDVMVGDRTIDVHIRKLREKLGDTYIKTLKGIGYKFEL